MTHQPQQTTPPQGAAAPPRPPYRVPTMLAYLVMVVAGVGYFIGITAPMPEHNGETRSVTEFAATTSASRLNDASAAGPVIPATAYAELPDAPISPNHNWKTELASFKQTPWDPFAPIELSHADKLAALEKRSRTRAFNGAPPTVPHPIDQVSSQACMACHGEGLKSATLRASKMPHPFYANCTQCHVEDHAKFASAAVAFESDFVGLPAPTAGPRAFDNAPPVIPHATWMREDCLSCHGRTAEHGMKTTHAWRTNCQQCHAPQTDLNRIPFVAAPSAFLPGPDIATPAATPKDLNE